MPGLTASAPHSAADAASSAAKPPNLESEYCESGFGFAMAELAGAEVPLPCSLLVAYQTESAK